MSKEFRDLIQPFAEEPLNRQVILDLLKDYKRPNDKIHELIKSGDLIQVRRGLYVPGPNLKIEKPNNFLIANHLRGPSYVSMETALSYWGLIPERVYEIASVTIKPAIVYKTPVAQFRYYHSETPYYTFGIMGLKITNRQRVLIATPEKALCDKIVMTSGIFLRSIRQAKEFLLEDLRMEEEGLRKMRIPEIRSWTADSPKRASITMLIKTLEEL